MILVIGEILVDIFPQYRRIGGAPFNFSYHLQQMGLPVCFISRIGQDNIGKEISDFLWQNRFDAGHIQSDPRHPTGKVMVHPQQGGSHSFEIITDTAYDHIELPDSPDFVNNQTPELIYFGTLVQRTPEMAARLKAFLDNRADSTKCFCDINLRPGCYSTETVLASIDRADILKINDAELIQIRAMFGRDAESEKDFIAWLMKTHDIEMVSLTMAERGSRLYTPGFCHETRVPDKGPVVDTVGAGDAYAAVVALGYLQNWSPEHILDQAAAFAARICQIQGAIPENRDFYSTLL
ncbi:MAG: carbohydrate kinase [Desulfosalsimonas sp.]|uniref:carbohydrate kinase family protein n=1 Tax=Desulfosalsimonas sp. TaxID=3073848 RepID=UPI003970ABE2